ncbi:MAG: hypothetical protein ACLUOI_12890 [Eisenbergiella sp.]
MDQATGEELLVDGQIVTARMSFTPEEADGEVTYRICLMARWYRGER